MKTGEIPVACSMRHMKNIQYGIDHLSEGKAASAIYPMVVLLVSVLVFGVGCSRTDRTENRLEADREAYDVIAERNDDSRWRTDDYSIEIDSRSRYFDPCDPDRPPMPQDDPASNRYMRIVDGKKGWGHWEDNGLRTHLENPAWRDALDEYVEVGKDGAVKLDVDSALKLAYMHSPSHQSQLETLYLSALDVTAERFRFDTQFFGGLGAYYAQDRPAGSESLTVGGDPRLEARKKFAGAGDLLVGFANSFVVNFVDGSANFASSLATFSFVQPLLRGGGRDVALEQLTFVERNLLANLRAYQQYRQGFYTDVAIGELGVAGTSRSGYSTTISSFSGQGDVGGYIGLLQQLQQIRNTEDSLSLQERTLLQLEAHLEGGVIDLVQVDQFRQSIETERSFLLQNQNSFDLSLDYYKTYTLGLPPDLPVKLDDGLIVQFQFVDRDATAIQDSISELQDRLGVLPDDVGVEPVAGILKEAFAFLEPIRRQLVEVGEDLVQMEAAAPIREKTITKGDDLEEFREDRSKLHEGLAELERKYAKAEVELKGLQKSLSVQSRRATVEASVIWLGDLLRLVQGSILVQARARLEAVTIDEIEMTSEDAFEIALANRMDFMNGRASLVDDWRLIQLDADALQSVLNFSASGSIGTARNNPVSFRNTTSNLQLGLQFDAPLTRLIERNSYRQSLIDYQRSRREFIRSHDSLKVGLRGLLRQIEQLRRNLEIQRRAVAIAIRRVDLTREAFYAPVRPRLPGQPPVTFGPTAATNLLTALSSLRNTQNSFMSVWLNYFAARMRLDRELGIMQLDEAGRWVDKSTKELDDDMESSDMISQQTLPPAIPAEWMELSDRMPAESIVPDAGQAEYEMQIGGKTTKEERMMEIDDAN